jgi:hypothetical protein
MTLTPDQLASRRTRIHASEVPALFACAFDGSTAGDVVARKLWPEQFADEPISLAAQLGHVVEPWLVDQAKAEYGFVGGRIGALVVAQDFPALGATYDWLADDGCAAMQAKTTGVLGSYAEDGWGDPDTDQVPMRVKYQAQAELKVMPSIAVYIVPALIGSRRRVDFFRINPDPEIQQSIRERVKVAYDALLAGELPAEMPTLHTLKRLPIIDAETPIRTEDFHSWWRTRQETAALTKQLEAAKQREIYMQRVLLSQMGSCSKGFCECGWIERKHVNRRGYTVQPSTYTIVRGRSYEDDAIADDATA